MLNNSITMIIITAAVFLSFDNMACINCSIVNTMVGNEAGALRCFVRDKIPWNGVRQGDI